MTKQELRAGLMVWSNRYWRYLYYTGIELDRKGYNNKTGDYTPRHVYRFCDICDAVFDFEADELKELTIK